MMKCKNCGTEITITDLICPACKEPVVLELGDEFLDDEILSEVIASDSGINDALESEQAPDNKSQKEPSRKKKNKSRKFTDFFKTRSGIGLLCVLFIFIVVIIVAFIYINSYAYCIKQADNAYAEQNYQKALNYYILGTEKDSGRTEAYIGIGNVMLSEENYDKASQYFINALNIDPSNEEALAGIIDAYMALGDDQALTDLYEASADMKDFIASRMVRGPVFTANTEEYNSESETYEDDFYLALTSLDGCNIYYTADGEDPDGTNEILYTEPVLISEGNNIIKAYCINTDGIRSNVITEKYNVVYPMTTSLFVNPESGEYKEGTTVYIDVPKGCTVYYTWDDSTPTTSSAQYKTPLELPDGNNILSVIVVNAHGMISDVFKYNYICLSE